MTLKYRAAVLHQAGKPLAIEQVSSGDPAPTDVVVRVRAAGLCHTDLEVIDGSLRYPLPMILGHEAAGVVEQIGPEVDTVKVGDHVILSWNPHCGHCFQCDRGQPILCDTYLGEGPKGLHFDGRSKASLGDGAELRHLMFLGAFAEICTVPAQQAIVVPKEIPFDRACLIGCGVMTGVGAALNVADIAYGDNPAAFRQTAEAVRVGGQVIWLGKIDVANDVSFRWGSLMGEKRLRRSSYGGARPLRDFPLLARAYLEGRLKLDELITARARLDDINRGFADLREGRSIRTVIEF